MEPFKDNLPVDGIVIMDGKFEVLYRGYLAGHTDQCAVKENPFGPTEWVDRSRLKPKEG